MRFHHHAMSSKKKLNSIFTVAMALVVATGALLARAQESVFEDGSEKLILTFESAPLTVAFQDSVYTYQARVSNPIGLKITFLLIDPPAGMTIDPDNGVIDWTPDTAGDFNVTVEASGSTNTIGQQTWTIRVALPSPGFAMVDDGWTFTEASPWSQSAAFIHDPTVMDVDQDGRPDIVYAGPLYDNNAPNGWVDQVVPFRWLQNSGDGTFVQGNQGLIPASSALTHTRHMSVEDFNQDNLDDLVAVSHGFDVPPFPKERNLVLQSRSGQSLVDSELDNPDFDYLGFSHGLDTGDINGDGIKDIVTLDLFTETGLLQDKLKVLINDGTGEFTRDTSAVQINEQTGVLDVALIDLTGDGADELIFGSWGDDLQNQIFWNDGSGSFSQDHTVLPRLLVNGVGQYDTLAIASTDLNFDGLPDLIFSVSRDYAGGYLQFLINNGDQTFTDSTDYYSAGEVFNSPGFWIHFDDFNGDTLDDFLIGVSASPFDNSNVNNLWLRSADGRFEKYALPLNEFNDWGDAWPVDYDLDGDTDLVFRYPPRFYDGYISSPRWRTIENKLNSSINGGHSGAWFNPQTSGQGQLIDVEPESQFMFLAWFAYTDANSGNPNEQHWLTAQGSYSGATAVLPVYETLGGKFDDPQTVSSSAIGTIELSFDDCANGLASYTIDTWGVDGSFPLSRVIPGSENVCSGLAVADYSGLVENDGWDGAWYDPETAGQGFLIDVHPDPDADDFIFIAWFTYGDANESGQRWLTAQGPMTGTQADIAVYETKGGSFDDPTAVSSAQIGTMNIEFTTCNSASLTYELNNESLSGSIDIERVIPGTEALCEELADLK